jgi:hypothetical protein
VEEEVEKKLLDERIEVEFTRHYLKRRAKQVRIGKIGEKLKSIKKVLGSVVLLALVVNNTLDIKGTRNIIRSSYIPRRGDPGSGHSFIPSNQSSRWRHN